MLVRIAVLLTLAASLFSVAAFAANTRLYLTDGDYHLVKEYEVQGQRIRYLSAERDQWEQIPLAMVDLERTEQETAAREAELAAELAIDQAEEEALRAARALVASVPYNLGAYYLNGEDLTLVPSADVIETTSKTRRILQVLSPAPIVPGKVTVTIEEPAARFRVNEPRPEFFFRLAENERFGIVRLKPEDEERIVEVVEQNTQTEEVWEQLDWVDVFREQVDDRLYRVWPQAEIEPGEYALVELTHGQMNIQVWPFGVD